MGGHTVMACLVCLISLALAGRSERTESQEIQWARRPKVMGRASRTMTPPGRWFSSRAGHLPHTEINTRQGKLVNKVSGDGRTKKQLNQPWKHKRGRRDFRHKQKGGWRKPSFLQPWSHQSFNEKPHSWQPSEQTKLRKVLSPKIQFKQQKFPPKGFQTDHSEIEETDNVKYVESHSDQHQQSLIADLPSPVIENQEYYGEYLAPKAPKKAVNKYIDNLFNDGILSDIDKEVKTDIVSIQHFDQELPPKEEPYQESPLNDLWSKNYFGSHSPSSDKRVNNNFSTNNISHTTRVIKHDTTQEDIEENIVMDDNFEDIKRIPEIISKRRKNENNNHPENSRTMSDNKNIKSGWFVGKKKKSEQDADEKSGTSSSQDSEQSKVINEVVAAESFRNPLIMKVNEETFSVEPTVMYEVPGPTPSTGQIIRKMFEDNSESEADAPRTIRGITSSNFNPREFPGYVGINDYKPAKYRVKPSSVKRQVSNKDFNNFLNGDFLDDVSNLGSLTPLDRPVRQDEAQDRQDFEPDIPILTQNQERDGDTYSFDFSTGNGISRNEVGTLGPQGQQAQGSWQYTAPNGELIQVSFVADGQGGFRPEGTNIFVPIFGPLDS